MTETESAASGSRPTARWRGLGWWAATAVGVGLLAWGAWVLLGTPPDPAPAPSSPVLPAVAGSGAAEAGGEPPAPTPAPAPAGPPPDVQQRRERFEERSLEVRSRAERFFVDNAVGPDQITAVVAALGELRGAAGDLLSQPVTDHAARQAQKGAIAREVQACAAEVTRILGPELGARFEAEVLSAARGNSGRHSARGGAAPQP